MLPDATYASCSVQYMVSTDVLHARLQLATCQVVSAVHRGKLVSLQFGQKLAPMGPLATVWQQFHGCWQALPYIHVFDIPPPSHVSAPGDCSASLSVQLHSVSIADMNLPPQCASPTMANPRAQHMSAAPSIHGS